VLTSRRNATGWLEPYDKNCESGTRRNGVVAARIAALTVGAGQRQPSVLRGVAWMVLAALGSSVMNAVIHGLGASIHSFEIAFFRNLFGFAALVPLLLRAGPGALRTSKLPLHGLRGVLNAVAMLSFFYALPVTPLAEVAALGFTAPLFATVLAVLLLGERVGLRRSLGVLAGFGGALVIIRPGFETVSLGTGLLLLSSLAWSAALIDIKVLSRTETSLAITLYATLFLTPITLLCALPFWTWPEPQQWLLLAVVGGLGSVVQMSVAQAFHEADASQVLPIDFTKLIWASLIGWVVFSQPLDAWVLLGGVIIFSSVTYIAWREARERNTARKP
jgi:drug/metabolite transporter (DMT)-like permease